MRLLAGYLLPRSPDMTSISKFMRPDWKFMHQVPQLIRPFADICSFCDGYATSSVGFANLKKRNATCCTGYDTSSKRYATCNNGYEPSEGRYALHMSPQTEVMPPAMLDMHPTA